MMLHIRGGLLGLVLALATPGCQGGECKAKLAAMRAALEQLPPGADGSTTVAVEPGASLPQVDRGQPVRSSSVAQLRVRKGGTVLYDEREMQPETVAHAVLMALDPDSAARVQMRLNATGPIELPPIERAVLLAFDADEPVAPHVGWLRELATEGVELRMLVHAPAPSPPRTPGGDAALAKVRTVRDPSELAFTLAEAMRQVSGTCEPLRKGFESMASAPSDRRKGLLINTALEGAEQCGCEKVDVDGLSAVTWYLLAGDDPGLRWLPLKIEAGASRQIPGDATAQAMAKIVAEEPRVGFAPH